MNATPEMQVTEADFAPLCTISPYGFSGRIERDWLHARRMANDGASDTREARLAEALRANLRKRKAQGKARDAAPQAEDSERPEDTDKD